MSDYKGKKRSKAYYGGHKQTKRKRMALDTGMKGFLLTCNKNEKQCVREAYNIFNEYADKLYGVEKLNDGSDNDHDESDDDDIEKSLARETAALQQAKQSTNERRFQVMESGANNCVFIKTNLDDPASFVHSIMSDFLDSGVQKCRFINRMLPVENTCKAFVADIKEMAETVLRPHFMTEFGTGRTYRVNFKVRNNGSIGRDVVRTLAELVADMNPMNKVDLTNGELVIVVEIIRKICCMSVIKDFNKFRKYNLLELAQASQQREEVDVEKTADGETSTKTCNIEKKPEETISSLPTEGSDDLDKNVNDTKDEKNVSDGVESVNPEHKSDPSTKVEDLKQLEDE